MRCPLVGKFDIYISKFNWGKVICPLNMQRLSAFQSLLLEVLMLYKRRIILDECNRGTTVLCMHERCLFGHQST